MTVYMKRQSSLCIGLVNDLGLLCSMRNYHLIIFFFCIGSYPLQQCIKIRVHLMT